MHLKNKKLFKKTFHINIFFSKLSLSSDFKFLM